MPITEFSSALNQVCNERGISPDSVVDAIKTSLVAAYKKDFPGTAAIDLVAEVDKETGESRVYKTLDDGSLQDITPPGFGRIAAQTAKQVILQKIREEEKGAVMEEYKKRIGQVVAGHIFRMEKGMAIVDLGKTQALLPQSEQIPAERYYINQRLRVLVKEIREGTKGPEVIVSRSDPRFIMELFATEVPELASGVVKIEAIAREAGSRTKMAVSSSQERVDPVGSCVGQKGVRVTNVIAEIGDEKIDIISYSSVRERFIAASLSPAKVRDVVLDVETKTATIEVAEDQLSLAIGREGQNVRLAAKLTGWKIDIKGANSPQEGRKSDQKDQLDKSEKVKTKPKTNKTKAITKKLKKTK
ncbi:transcription termination/antitermination protein NusA [candidate division WWE3 bacterium CG08_land_8_20_14_0_20_40_13]|uniref:Transcription termination/antitermination protein NusA n=1 Tax=candidate division WWE3 bacterium CG08_land_8_20_14_0_20_40_13 TaxID=1975084 RepID=A0A2H0XD16_UNCKA|nr:MAG: transcription termination/antitermination protein NusA [candidate division WWE3 bacterium CG08_land_8_20_14_0_20_40_13]